MTSPTPPTQLPVLPNGIGRIALSFSGGGFRAAAFTLGCTTYLNKIIYDNAPLLHKVRFISSASGGSITNLTLSAMLREGHDFKTIYRHLLERLNGTDLMDKVFEVLNDQRAWKDRPGKSRNLINAFAMVYDDWFFNHAAFETLSRPVPDGQFVIEEVCINTTEFTNGLNFRWGNGTGLVGNKYISFRDGLTGAAKIKLGDILATSSCFPAGFEPIMFPADFANQDVSANMLRSGIIQRNNFTEAEVTTFNDQNDINFGFMDGGIDDNQGIYAFLLADQRKGAQYDFYFTCDVTSNYVNDPFTYPEPVKGKAFDRTGNDFLRGLLNKIGWYFGITAIVLLLSIVAAVKCFWTPVALPIAGVAFAAICLPLIAACILKSWIKKLLTILFPSPGGSGTWGIIFNKYKSKLWKLRLSQILTMLMARATSVLLLADTIYLKRIRQLSYNYLYAVKANDVYKKDIAANNAIVPPGIINTGKLWEDHIAQTTVYKLATKNDGLLQAELQAGCLDKIPLSGSDNRSVYKVLYPISPALRAHADIATAMDTTLWFDANQQKNESLKSLIITGQATMCFNLLRIAYRFGNTDPSWLAFRAGLIADWEQFRNKPDWLY